jgi:methylmalonyl-CoA mutase
MSDLKLASEFPNADDETWRKLVDKALRGADFEKTLVSHTYDGLTVKPLYTHEDEPGKDIAGVPGGAPYTRGFHATKTSPPWQIRQLHGSPEPDEANAAILQDLEGGATEVELRVAAPEQSGVQINGSGDLERALQGVALDLAGVWLEAGHGTRDAAGYLQAVWKTNGVDGAKALGGFGCDPLGTLAVTGGYPLSLDQAFGEMAGLAKQTLERYPNVTAIRVDTRPYHGGGGSEAQELACLCATLAAYLRVLDTAGISPRDGLAQIELSLACDQDFFAGIAKLRAARALVARIADLSGAADALESVRAHAMTSMRMFSRHDPQVNILRTTVACAAAAIGGADSITVLPYTYAIGQPDNFARRIARNIQNVLQEESSLGTVTDPIGGSWYAENFTLDLAQKSWELFQEIESHGGMAETLSTRFVQNMLTATAEERARDVAHGELELTGVSSFANIAETRTDAEPHPLPVEMEEPAITVEPVPLRRPAEPFECLRDAADETADKSGSRPAVTLVTLGPERKHSEPATYARRFFAAGGLDAHPVDLEYYDSAASSIACICAADDDLESSGVSAAESLKDKGAARIYSVGRAGDMRKRLKDASVDEFLHPGCDMIAILKDAHDVLGLRQR